MEIGQFIEDKLNHYAESIARGGNRIDEHALGELTFYMALRRIQEGKGTPQDIGTMDAVNDTLQEFGVLEAGATFLKK